ncbi:MAG TPA: C13 family peptidase [Dyella sp.]|uniref:C13 family peptidase n=1 Tax=Dyella sp. TaxID=1869338 RepID=UPI002B721236|nr:C13 family peptidase [Dyella sp.]HTV83965.1 C13 family peptidase [Dyella sp.]HUB46907.1 C13 family peptidase [Acetobacteraceae bacterium]
MRTLLTALLAFAAGVLLMTLVGRHSPSHVASATNMASGASTANNPATSSSSSDSDDSSDSNDNWPNQGPSPEQVFYAQPGMMHTALSQLGPRVPGKTNLYLLTFAGDGGEDVFRNEAEYAAQLFTKRFGPTAHALVLENNPTTLQTHPLADWSNLESALDGLWTVMKPDQDILVLYLTSHGDEDHNLLVDMDPLPLDQIGAPDLAGILKKHPFKWKVVVVNACYSGGFIPDLHSAGTLVLTAARTDRSSFGCGSDSDITYFGKAWLVDAMNRTDDFVDAFQYAKTDIEGWEKQDKLTPSEPQINIGEGIVQQLAMWRRDVKPGAAVPFAPPPASASSAPAAAQ